MLEFIIALAQAMGLLFAGIVFSGVVAGLASLATHGIGRLRGIDKDTRDGHAVSVSMLAFFVTMLALYGMLEKGGYHDPDANFCDVYVCKR